MWRHAQEWLGLDHVDARALWALFFAFSASVIQVSFGRPHLPDSCTQFT